MHGTDAKNVHCTFWNHWANCFGDIFLTLSNFYPHEKSHEGLGATVLQFRLCQKLLRI